MNEELFHKLLEQHLTPAFNRQVGSQEQKEQLLQEGMAPGDADNFLSRFKDGIRWKKDFGPEDLHAAIASVRADISNIHIKRLRDRFYANIDPDVHILIACPNGKKVHYEIRWFRQIPPLFRPDSGEEDRIPAPPGANFVKERHELPFATIKTLATSQRAFVFLPLGCLWYEAEETPFTVIWEVYTQEYWLLYDYFTPDTGDNCDVVPPAERRTVLPGTDADFSIGALSGLDLHRKEGTLNVISTDGFWVYPAGRFNGKIWPLSEDLSLDARLRSP